MAAIRTVDSATETTYTALLSDDIILCICTTAAITITLPAAVDLTGKAYSIKKLDVSANTVTLDGDGAETIDDDATRLLLVQYDAITVISDGTEWWIF